VPERSKWQVVAWAAAAVLLVLATVRTLGADSPPAPPVRVGGVEGGGARAAGVGALTGGSGGAKPGGLYVHVAGEVHRPGLFRVPEGSRTAAAVHIAGGPTGRAELSAVNLAQRLEDGQQVIVPRRGAVGVAAPGAVPGAPGPSAATSVSLTTATIEQLDQLDGIGPTLAQRIIDFRDENGGFRSLGQLQDVEGIGEKRFASLKEAVRP
jgi:competence protein ComEA